MRISSDKDDPSYHWLASRCVVKFNGSLLRRWVTADEETGMVEVHDIRNGKVDVCNGKVKTRVKHGHVVIEQADNVRAEMEKEEWL